MQCEFEDGGVFSNFQLIWLNTKYTLLVSGTAQQKLNNIVKEQRKTG